MPYYVIKRIFDFTAALLGLILLLPIFGVIAIAIKWDSRGPVFFKQKRMGKGGTIFHIYKFRTMVSDADRTGCPITVWNDHRITRVGGILRKYRLDELPQLINVVLGDMSLVGPRPELPKYKRCYSGSFRAVLEVRPGITDPATLYFRDETTLLRGRADPEEYYLEEILPKKLQSNLAYLSESTLRKDVQLIFKTLTVSFSP
ncbi:MAG: sugar transferase [Aliifodinibius sp.]|nr:sugar transferase [Fodinibius sp.]NIY27722.1 sugar transferase [Fodinibius sp.]